MLNQFSFGAQLVLPLATTRQRPNQPAAIEVRNEESMYRDLQRKSAQGEAEIKG